MSKKEVRAKVQFLRGLEEGLKKTVKKEIAVKKVFDEIEGSLMESFPDLVKEEEEMVEMWKEASYCQCYYCTGNDRSSEREDWETWMGLPSQVF